MKRSIIVLFLFFFTLLSYSQKEEFKSEFSYGVNGGVTLSKMRFVFAVPTTLLLQGQGGITVRYLSENNFGLQAELNYSLRGWKEATDSVRLNKYTKSLAYIELPFMTHIYINMGKRFRTIFNLGPQIGFNIGEKVIDKEIYVNLPDFHSNDSGIEPEETPSYYDQSIQKKFDYGIVGGAGFELRTGIGSFILEGRYYFGLSDIFNNNRSDYFQASSNQVISIKLSYLFR